MNIASLSTRVVRSIFLVCTPLLLLLSNLYLLATPAFIRYEYSKPSFPSADLYNDDERLSLAEATLYYLRSNEGVDYLTNLHSRGQPVYNAREIKHLVDVKRVMNAAFLIQGLCLLLLAAAAIFTWSQRQEWYGALRAIFTGCSALFVLLLAISLLAYANFDLFFTAFHRLFFEGDSWLFMYSDTLIQLFPVPFWIDATWMLALLTIGECFIVGTTTFVLLRRFQEQGKFR
ncbi:MAG: TIGR01906 family membrane protein [Candidatus Hadarchaeum sp.]